MVDERIYFDFLLPEKKWFPGVVAGAGKQPGCEGGGHNSYDIMYKDSMLERQVRRENIKGKERLPCSSALVVKA